MVPYSVCFSLSAGLTDEDQDRSSLPRQPSARHESTAQSDDNERRAVVKPVKIRSHFNSVNNDAENSGN